MFKILVAEDNRINIKVAEYTLKTIASKLDFAKNGEEVLEKIQHNSYDVILMDVMMPVMDGCEATEIIRNNEKESRTDKSLKIIAMTANNQPEEIERCLAIGMNDFLAKPFTTKEALNVIQLVCKEGL